MSEKKSQASKIFNYMMNGNSINPVSALNKFGCFRLSERIREIRIGMLGDYIKKGWYITKKGARVRSYWIAL